MKKEEYISIIANKLGVTKSKTQEIIDEFIAIIKEEVKKGNSFGVQGFGTFAVAVRKERNGVNPKTKEKILIPSSKKVKFKASPSLNEIVK